MEKRDPAGVFEVRLKPDTTSDTDGRVGSVRLQPDRPRLSSADHLSRRSGRRDRRSLSLRPRAHRFRSASARAKARTTAPSRSSARIASSVGHDRRRALRGVGAERRSRQRDRRLQRLGRPRHADAAADRPASGRSSSPACRDGEKYKFEIRTRTGAILKKTDPFARAFEAPPQTAAIVRDISQLRVARRRLDDGARRARRLAREADEHLRSAPRLVGARARGRQPLPDLSRTGDAAGAVREGDGLHAHRAAAGDGASVRRLVGLPGARLLRADGALRPARGLQALRRRLSPGRPRRHPRLGAGPLSEGRARPRALRRHRALRARGPAPGRAPGLGHADLQLRPQRGPQLPALERAVLARGVSHRRPARGRGRLDALSRLLAPAGAVDPEPVRRPREPRGDQFPAAAERASRTASIRGR